MKKKWARSMMHFLRKNAKMPFLLAAKRPAKCFDHQHSWIIKSPLLNTFRGGGGKLCFSPLHAKNPETYKKLMPGFFKKIERMSQ